jgi:hypothetical protein
MLIHNPIFTGSIQLNGTDISQISTVSSDSSSFASRITSTESTASAFISASGSLSTRVTATEATSSAYVTASGSLSTRVTAAEATASAFITASGSLSARIASNEAKTGSFATTGSNQFNGSQTVTGSLTATGTIVAQTLVVQTITSSVDFVTGSTRFGSTTGNTHQFTGSVSISGSQLINGNVGIGTTDLGPDGLSLFVQNNYSWSEGSGNAYATLFRQRNSGATVVASGYKRSNTAAFASSYGTSMARAAIAVGYSNGSIAFFTDTATNVANGTDITPTERVTIINSGFVGIGTSSPTGLLHLSGSDPAFRIQSSTTGNMQMGQWDGTYNRIQGSGRDFLLINTDATNMLFSTNSSTRMTITSNGNFDYGGINAQSSNNSVYRQAFYGALSIMWRGGEDAYLNSNHTYGSSNTNVATYTSANGLGRLTIGGGNFEWGTYDGSVTAGTAYTISTKFIINKAGSVGIGTDSPSSILNVHGTTGITWAGNGVTSGLVTIGTPLTGGSLFVNTVSDGGSGYQSGLAIDGASASQISTINIKALGVKFGGFWGSNLAFHVSNTTNLIEAMRITRDGEVKLTSGISSRRLYAYDGGAGNTNGLGLDMGGNSYEYSLFFAYGVSDNGRMTAGSYDGSNVYRTKFTLFGNGNYSFAGSNVSDIRLKQSIDILNINALDRINQLVPKTYYMSENQNLLRYGFIAQEVQEILPDLINGVETEDTYLGLDYNGVLAVAVKAIQELSAKVAALEAQQ